jgi:hypothetical protein
VTSINRRTFCSAAALAAIGRSTMTARHAYAEEPLLSSPDQMFLGDQARAILDSARLMPGQEKGKYRNQTPYEVHVPGGNMGYPAFWVRDAVMMLESDFIELAELEGWIRLMSSVLRDRDWNVRPGVVVPAFAVPDHINLDGKATFYPGNYETGSKQGGNPFGKYPPLDDHFYYIFAIYYQWKKSGSTAFFRSQVKTAFGEMQLAELCQRVYHVAPSDPATALCTAGDVDTENAKDFGFCDSVSKSGKLLFTSVLKYVAALRLAELLNAAGFAEKTEALHEDARKIKAAIPATFLHSWPNGKEAWLDSATGVGRQPDVWGSAYAVYSDAVDSPTQAKIGRALVRGYRERTAVREGFVRSVLTNDPANPNGWQKTVSAPGVYQNGGYWGTPVGWYLVAMHKHDSAASAEMARDYIGFLRNHRRPDGLAESWEWFNPDTGRSANPLYVATIDLPYGCLCEAKLIHRTK